jgi:FKBP-type peptidyl-prolyl cis-trans isomerase 2
MSKAENGNKVKVHYKGSFDDGTVFDSSEGREPLEFELGSGQVIPGFNKNIEGMELNEKKTIKISSQEAYGEKRDELIMDFPKTEFPNDINPEVGQQLQMQNQEGQVFNVLVTGVSGETVTLDANHPLAGKNLNFDIELVEIVS